MANAKDIEKVLALAKDQSIKGRSKLAAAIGELYASRRGKLNDAERKLVGQIIGDLIQDTERSVRLTLAKELAKDKNAPRAGMTALANDVIEVAGFVLLNSPVLTDADLISVVEKRSQQHRLAIAGRPTIPEAVCDALIDKGEEAVVVKTLNNKGAKISPSTIERVVEESQYFEAYHAPLAGRSDLTAGQANQLSHWVSEELSADLAKRHGLKQKGADKGRNMSVTDALAVTDSSDTNQTMKAQKVVDELEESGALTQDIAMKALSQGEIVVFETIISRLSGLPTATTRTVLYESRPEYLAVLCKSADFNDDQFQGLLRLFQKANNARSYESMNFRYDITGKFSALSKTAADQETENWRRTKRLSLPSEITAMPGAV